MGRYYGQFDPPLDRVLHERYFPGRRGGVFVECGAFDGLLECSCKFFEESLGWTGVNVEPSPPIFARLAANRPGSRNLNAALAARDGRATFHGVVHPEHGELCTNGSLDHHPAHAAAITEARWELRDYGVETITWATLCARAGLTRVDLLVLDVEGGELDVLEGMRGAAVLPEVLCAEHGHLGVEALRAAVEPLGYVHDGDVEVNSFFLRADVAATYPPRAKAGAATAPEAGALAARLDALERQARDLRRAVTSAHYAAMDALEALLPPDRPLPCPVCDRVTPRDRLEIRTDEDMFGGGRLERAVCPGCGCGFGPTKVTGAPSGLLSADYGLLYEDDQEGDGTRTERRAFDLLGHPPDRPVLNWGCGRWSRCIDELRAEGYDAWGYEPSASDGSPFVVSERGSISPVFGGLFSNNVIEHMVRPVEEFRYLHSILRPGARMAHASPCHEWRYAASRYHVFFPLGDSPRVLAERTGFRAVERVAEGEFIAWIYERI